ncbi:MAG: hypothetical protein A3B68_01340 [Candidatus Melainabacteria bacterium RIFCSPHIGHO2_02_FULL_34_12]|nr:MAG: hypothetical protein A3B68_01340 [Candidatus Melainabacteria bacterium RIFCSPHIGHO2_02_FULL_34_12]
MKNIDLRIDDMLSGEITSSEIVDSIFNSFDKQLLDRNEILLDFKKVTFVSVLFLERLESFVKRAKDINVKVQITNVSPVIYKVFQVAKVKSILEVCS